MAARTPALIGLLLVAGVAATSCRASDFPESPTPVANANVTTLSGGSWSGPVVLADGTSSLYNMTLIARGLGLTTALQPQAQTGGSIEVSGGFETGSRLTGTVAGMLDGTLQRGSFRGTLTSDAPLCVRSYSGPVTESGLAWVATGDVPPGCPLTFVLVLSRDRGPRCSYNPSLSPASFSGQGGTGEVKVETQETCVWMAEPLVPWVEVSDAAPRVGSGTIAFSVTPNQGAERSGELRIANVAQAITVQQGPACTFAVSASRYSVAAAGGSGEVALTASAACRWTAQSAASWLTLSPAEGVGSATIKFSALPNAGESREGTFAVAGQTITVTQSVACNVVITPTAERFSAGGGAGTISVAAPPGCAWTASTSADWIGVGTPAASGDGRVNYKVATNTVPSSREATIDIAGRSVTISQDALSCSYFVGAEQLRFPREGGQARASVTATPGCEWAVSADVSWVTFDRPSGTGTGEFVYIVAPFTCGQPGGTANIALTAYEHRVVDFRITRETATCDGPGITVARPLRR